MDRRSLVIASLAVVAVLAAVPAFSAEMVAFDAKAFAAAQQANKSIVVAVNAPCKQ